MSAPSSDPPPAADKAARAPLLGLFDIRRRAGFPLDEAIIAGFALAVHAGAVFMNAVGASGLPLLRCPFLLATGLPCPTCGSTRAILALDRGEVWTALRLNPFAALAGVFLLLFLVHFGWSAASGRVLSPRPALRRWTFRISMVLVFGVWALRWALGDLAMLTGG